MDFTVRLLDNQRNLVERMSDEQEARGIFYQTIKDAHGAQVPVAQIALVTGYTKARVYQILGHKEARI